MANTLTTLQMAIISKKLEAVLRENAVMAKIVNTDYSSDIATQGKSVTANFPGSFTAADKTAGTDFSVQNATASAVTITLDSHKVVPFQIDDIEEAFSTPKNLVDKYLGPAFKALANKVDTSLLALYSDVSYNVGTAGTDITLKTINLADGKLNTNVASLEDRYCVISAKDKTALQDPSVATNSVVVKVNESGSDGVLRKSQLGPLFGFDQVQMDQNVQTATVSGTLTTYNLAFQRGAFALAVRRLALPPSNNALGMYVTDPVSGLEFRVIISYNHKGLGTIGSVDIVYGVKTLDAKKACVVLA